MSMNEWERDHEARWESHFDDASHDDPPPADDTPPPAETQKVPMPITVRFQYEFDFEDYNGPFYSRTAKDGRPRWWVVYNGKRIGRITVYGPEDYVAYPDHEDSVEDFTGPASYCSSLVDACMALVRNPEVARTQSWK